MRGKGRCRRFQFFHFGITPACAGKRGQRKCANCTSRDHPRVCGEKYLLSRTSMCTKGSPPRVRGKATRLQMPMRPPGITPAYAGKRSSCRPSACRFRDHPRVCGEKLYWHQLRCTGAGSPPRMRGKECREYMGHLCPGITPAYAGKRPSAGRLSGQSGDHPRVCGEKPGGRLRELVYPGSPPRMRGKDGRTSTGGLDVGITPACAGKSARRQAGPPGPAPPPQMRSGWSPPLCTGRQCRTRKSTHARRARIPAPAHTPAPQ